MIHRERARGESVRRGRGGGAEVEADPDWLEMKSNPGFLCIIIWAD